MECTGVQLGFAFFGVLCTIAGALYIVIKTCNWIGMVNSIINNDDARIVLGHGLHKFKCQRSAIDHLYTEVDELRTQFNKHQLDPKPENTDE